MKHILCFGDSNTWGLIPGTSERYAYGIRWTGLLETLLVPHGYRIIEEGLCGRTTIFEDTLRPSRNGSALLPFLLETHSPLDGVILMLGTNDCKSIYRCSPKDIGNGLEILLDQILRYDPNCPVLVVSPIHLGNRVWEHPFDPEFDYRSVFVSKELAKRYASIARKRGLSFLDASDYADPSPIDQEHMDSQGHADLATAIFKKIMELSW